ncbi:MAG: 4Fe-4S dicluster domain-containing protein [Candidatus Korarchaeota archaeon]|nr:4Fe-4S dicluster domain-containing protein [Thermoproteota archaeon]MCR8462891.1 4Fe-4S dicluster domain-containing protein [Thermoproteota archaeon]MCR8470363.1 4Fe-4S dicluster domain-containing protein [Thermoproteota archaeon]MCR8472028.1 4Fe-4S dicluster domain-containing protein [Thermoproteota archaeon]MCR8472961.1 4Fe-4S dicluster domain-containing protein [Thermoproteota archaeon]
MTNLADKILEITGEDVYLCYFCGKCGAGCPMADKMDHLPYQVIHMVQLNDMNALNAKSIWICATCFTCSVRCPRNLDVARIMEGLRTIKVRAQQQTIDLRKVEDLEKLPPIALVAAGRKYT